MNYSLCIPSPIGKLYLVTSDVGLVSLDTEITNIYKHSTPSKNHTILIECQKQLDEYFCESRKHFDIPLELNGSAFQVKAWKALIKIPFGEVWSYGKQAKYLKKPTAQRAVGGANGKNPIPIIIPCHRVVGSTGKLTGYSGGMKMKIALLKHEGHQIDGLQLIN